MCWSYYHCCVRRNNISDQSVTIRHCEIKRLFYPPLRWRNHLFNQPSNFRKIFFKKVPEVLRVILSFTYVCSRSIQSTYRPQMIPLVNRNLGKTIFLPCNIGSLRYPTRYLNKLNNSTHKIYLTPCFYTHLPQMFVDRAVTVASIYQDKVTSRKGHNATITEHTQTHGIEGKHSKRKISFKHWK